MNNERKTPDLATNKKKIYQQENKTNDTEAEEKIASLLDEEEEINSDGNKNSLIHMGCTNSC